MIFEITRDYSIIVPLMIANLISYFIGALERKPRPRSFSDAAEVNINLAERPWKERTPACRMAPENPARFVLAKLSAAGTP
jgi:hypothetical protein